MGVLAVPNADPAAGKVGDLDAVAVGEAEGTLDPARIWCLMAVERQIAHVLYLAECRWLMTRKRAKTQRNP